MEREEEGLEEWEREVEERVESAEVEGEESEEERAASGRARERGEAKVTVGRGVEAEDGRLESALPGAAAIVLPPSSTLPLMLKVRVDGQSRPLSINRENGGSPHYGIWPDVAPPPH